MKPWPFPRRTRILAVDDEVGFTRLLKLAAAHYDIRTENDPARAIEAAKEFQPHLILLDRYMPGMSGDSLARTLKEHPKLRDIPIAFITATVPRAEMGGFATHLDGCPILAKPVSIDAIDECVKACIGN